MKYTPSPPNRDSADQPNQSPVAGGSRRREPAVLTAEEAFSLLGIDRTTGYKAIRSGTFPVPVVRIGRLIRIPTAPLMSLLEGKQLPPTGTSEGGS